MILLGRKHCRPSPTRERGIGANRAAPSLTLRVVIGRTLGPCIMKSLPPQHDPGGKSRPPWPADSEVSAVFSPCQRYRYQLREVWDPARPLVLWVLMNPSVACLDYSDPTLRRTGAYARAWGYGGQLVGNVHAYRATDKQRLLEVDDPIGPGTDRAIKKMAAEAKTVVLAYGQPPRALRGRGEQVAAILQRHPGLSYLRLAKDGTPVHPLYLPGDLTPNRYRPPSQPEA